MKYIGLDLGMCDDKESRWEDRLCMWEMEGVMYKVHCMKMFIIARLKEASDVNYACKWYELNVIMEMLHSISSW